MSKHPTYNAYDELTTSERLEMELSNLIRQTRIEGEGLPLKRVAEIIAENLDKSETKALAMYLLEKIVK